MKELEALNDIEHELRQRHLDMYVQGCDKEFMDILTDSMDKRFTLIRKALTPPTSDEVCKALSEYLKGDVRYEYGDFVYYHDNVDDGIASYFKDTKKCMIFMELPPHLVEMIAKFYKGEVQ